MTPIEGGDCPYSIEYQTRTPHGADWLKLAAMREWFDPMQIQVIMSSLMNQRGLSILALHENEYGQKRLTADRGTGELVQFVLLSGATSSRQCVEILHSGQDYDLPVIFDVEELESFLLKNQPPHFDVVDCALCGALIPVHIHNINNQPVCTPCYDRVNNYADRVQARLERMQTRAEKLSAEAESDLNRARDMASMIPFGQPILVGHHSEGRDRRYRDRIHKTYQRGFEKYQKAQRAERRIDAAEKNRAISSDDPAAVLKLQAKIDEAVKNQEEYKRINAAVRKLVKARKPVSVLGRGFTVQQMNDAAKADREAREKEQANYPALAPKLAEMLGYKESTALNLLTPDFMGRIGIPDYVLTNNNANIRRMRERLEDLKKQTARAVQQDTPEVQSVADVKIERDANDNRLRLIFPGKPSPEIIATLKRNGFVWSRYNMAWQRQLNNAAEYAAAQVLKVYQEKNA